MASPEVSARCPTAPKSETVRMPMRTLLLGVMGDERHRDSLRRHPLTPHVDLEPGAGLRLLDRQVRRADRRVDAWGHGAAADDVHLLPVQEYLVPVARHGLRLQHLESDQPALDALQLLALQPVEPRERSPLVE